MIDLCTPAPTTHPSNDPKPRRRPLAAVPVPNVPTQETGERVSYDGYLALCRMTRQASQRSWGKGEVVIQQRLGDVSVEDVVGAPTEIEIETTTTVLAERKERNVRAVMARSKAGRRRDALPPGKGFIRWGKISQHPRRRRATDDATVDESPRTLVPVDTLPAARTRYLQTFASHREQDVVHVEPNPDHSAFRRRDWSPVYACSYSHAAKRPSHDGPKLIALASESGTIKLLDTRFRAHAHRSAAPNTLSTDLYPHSNAIFDVQWDAADERLLTASGDQTGAVHRVGEGGVVREAVLVGHTSSVKTCAWYDQHTALTAGRDGNILIFDLRTAGHWSDSLGVDEGRYARARAGTGGYWDSARINPVMIVRNAHGDNCGRKVSARSAVRSVTSLLAVKSNPNLIASGGSADGIVKFWDLRAQLASTRRIYVSEAASQSLDRTADRGKRSRGIISLGEAKGNIYAMCNDARIHPHSIQSPHIPLPTVYTHQSLTTSSFYLKLAVSPCEQFLACGTAAGRFAMWAIGNDHLGRWDWTPGAGAGGVVNAIEGVECGFGNGHSRTVGAIDWAVDQIATGSDDYTSRIWNGGRVMESLREGRGRAGDWAGCEGLERD